MNSTNKSPDHQRYNNENVTSSSKQIPPNESQANQREFSIKVDEIIERELERLSVDTRLQKKESADISLLKKQWKDFCTTYKKLSGVRKKYEKNSGSTNRQK